MAKPIAAPRKDTWRMIATKEIVNRPCICCGAEQDELHLRMRFPQYPGPFEYRRCIECGVVFNSPRLMDLSQLYGGDYFYFWKSAEFMRRRVLEQVQRLVLPVASKLPGKRVMEVGSARGHFLYVLQQLGFDAHGIELSAEAAASGQRYLNVVAEVATVEEVAQNFHGPPYDLVITSCVLEHVAAPETFLTACCRLLNDEGVLVFDVPNIESENAKFLGPAWPYFQKYHVFLFNAKSIHKLLPKCGFEVAQVYSYNNGHNTPQERTRMSRMRKLLVALDRVYLYETFRRVYRGKTPNEQDAAEAVRSITLDQLMSLPEYAATPDARRPLAARMRGDHLVVVANKSSM